MNGIFSIGQSAPRSEPLGLLKDCHRRIEHALENLETLAIGPLTLSEQNRDVWDRALLFFRETAPIHTKDEECSLFPRLRAGGFSVPQLEELEQDHKQADTWHEEVDRLGCLWLESGILTPDQQAILISRVKSLAALYRSHIQIEEQFVFPLAEKVLPVDEQEMVRREMVSRRAIGIKLIMGILLLTVSGHWSAAAQTNAGSVVFNGSVRTRVEAWDWFGNGVGENQYAFSGTIARFGAAQNRKKLDWQVEAAAPILLGLPQNAVATGFAGALGLGANYYTANHRSQNVAHVFVKQANIRLKSIGGDARNSLKLGRFEFNDGAEVVSKNPTLASLKRNRIAQRLIGTFGWTHVGRSFDGFHFVASRKMAIHFVGALPTRGVFQSDGWGPLRTGFAYLSLNHGSGASDWRLFGIYYQDWRHILKTDNRPVAARRDDHANIRLFTYGGHYLFAQPTPKTGTFDLMAWGLVQNGKWGNLNHLAAAIALESGWQPGGFSKLNPWLRLGYSYGSGDGDPNDKRHGTFFQILPTPRPFARFPFFNLMNNQDFHGSISFLPSKTITVRAEAHHLRLSSAADQWLLGGGAFQPWSFGYVGRPSGATSGQPALANLFDCSLDWNVNARVTFSAYIGHSQGMKVIAATYGVQKHGNFGYLEASYRF